MFRQLVRDEAGMTMGLVVIMIVLIGVMGAGLLVFVQRDLESVVENNKGQRAFEMTEAGVQLAKEQLKDDSIPAHYNGGTDDIQWSKSKGGMTLDNLDGSATTTDSVKVEIEYDLDTANIIDRFAVVSTGTYGDAKRKVEAVFKRTGAILEIPPAYYSRSSIDIAGETSSIGVSFFARYNGRVRGSVEFGTTDDVMGKWAQTSDSYSYPNVFNNTPRPIPTGALPGIAVGNVLTLEGEAIPSQVEKGVRSFDKDTDLHVCTYYYKPPCVYNGVTLPESQKIAFPFSRDALPNDLEILREKAIQQENATGVDYYKDNLPVGTHEITSFPSDGEYSTVHFYRFPTYDPTNLVTWNVPLLCSDASRKGVIVVENGDYRIEGNRGGFNGTVLVYGATDPLTGFPYPDQGNFTAAGNACMTGYGTSTGDMFLSGKYTASNIPGLTELPLFRGSMQLAGWRELYQ